MCGSDRSISGAICACREGSHQNSVTWTMSLTEHDLSNSRLFLYDHRHRAEDFLLTVSLLSSEQISKLFEHISLRKFCWKSNRLDEEKIRLSFVSERHAFDWESLLSEEEDELKRALAGFQRSSGSEKWKWKLEKNSRIILDRLEEFDDFFPLDRHTRKPKKISINRDEGKFEELFGKNRFSRLKTISTIEPTRPVEQEKVIERAERLETQILPKTDGNRLKRNNFLFFSSKQKEFSPIKKKTNVLLVFQRSSFFRVSPEFWASLAPFSFGSSKICGAKKVFVELFSFGIFQNSTKSSTSRTFRVSSVRWPENFSEFDRFWPKTRPKRPNVPLSTAKTTNDRARTVRFVFLIFHWIFSWKFSFSARLESSPTDSDDSADENGDQADHTVYECPGLATVRFLFSNRIETNFSRFISDKSTRKNASIYFRNRWPRKENLSSFNN